MTEESDATDRSSGNASDASGWERSIWNSLKVQVAFLLTLSVLPLGLLAVLQTQKTADTAEDIYRASLAARTVAAVERDRRLIDQALGSARSLAGSLGVLDADLATCRSLMARAAMVNPTFRFVGLIEPDGRSTCNAQNLPLDLSGRVDIRRLLENPSEDVEFEPRGMIMDNPVVIVSVPVFTTDETFLGLVAFSFATGPMRSIGENPDGEFGNIALALSDTGEVLASSNVGEAEKALPVGFRLEDFEGEGPFVFNAVNGMGEMRDFVLQPMVNGRAYALGSWVPSLPASFWQRLASNLALPFVVWLATLAIAYWALDRSVVRPIQRIRTGILDFADSRMPIRSGDLRGAPREFADIGAAFGDMSNTILQDEAELNDRIYERDLLVKEVYHRVKNNMQLMSSIINMQIRDAEHDEAEAALRRVQMRLAGLAKFHRDLYQSTTLSSLRVDELLHDLSQSLFEIGGEEAVSAKVELDLHPVVLTPDQAGPLALLATEALINAAKYSASDEGGRDFVRMSLTASEDDPEVFRLVIENSIKSDVPSDRIGLGTRLITAFASQLEGKLDRSEADGTYTVSVVFRRRWYSEAMAGPEAGPDGIYRGPGA